MRIVLSPHFLSMSAYLRPSDSCSESQFLHTPSVRPSLQTSVCSPSLYQRGNNRRLEVFRSVWRRSKSASGYFVLENDRAVPGQSQYSCCFASKAGPPLVISGL